MTTSDPSNCRRKIAEESHKAIRKIQTSSAAFPIEVGDAHLADIVASVESIADLIRHLG